VESSSRAGEWSHAARICVACFAIIVTASFLAYSFVPPRWKALGFPSYHGYGKNVEQAALLLTVLSISVLVVFSRGLALSLTSVAWLSIVLALINVYYTGGVASAILLGLVAVCAGYLTWYDRLRDRAGTVGQEGLSRRDWAVSLLLLFVLGGWLFLDTFRTPETIDLHHHGEVITSALDLLNGGVPFRTFFWPHGASDTGVAAALIGLSGNQGLGTITALRAITVVLGLVALFLLVLGLMRRPLSAIVLAGLAGLAVRYPLVELTKSLFPIAAILLLSVRVNNLTLFGAGVLTGLGYLWRIETGMYGLAAIVVYMFIDCYYNRGYSRGGRVWENLVRPRAAKELVTQCTAFLLGVAGSLILVRLCAGFPTAEWFETTLVHLPRYHADSTGYPLPLVWKGAELPRLGAKIALVILPGVLMLAVGLYAVTLKKAIDRRLPLAGPRDRFFTLSLIYSLFYLKTIMDRSTPSNIQQGSLLILLVVCVDGLECLLGRFRSSRGLITSLGACALLVALVGANYLGWGPRLAIPSAQNLRILRDCFRPTTTPEEIISLPPNPLAGEIWKGVKQVRDLLHGHGVGDQELVIYHSGALLYPLLGRNLPTKYYCLGWAADHQMEEELIGELERSRVRAFLHVNGVGRSLPEYDVPDSHRIPLVHQYIADKERTGTRYETLLGTLFIRTNP
jgi:hypothetical protein